MSEQESPEEQAMPSDIDMTQTSQSEESGADETVDIRPSHEEAAEEAIGDVVEAELARAEIEDAEEEAVEEATEAVITGEMAKAEIDAVEEAVIEQTIETVEEAEAAKAEIDRAEEAAIDDAIAIADSAGDDATQEAAADAAIDAALAGESAKAEIEEAEEEAVEEALEELEEAEEAKAEIEAAEEVIVAETAEGIAEAEEAKAELDQIEEAAAEEAIVESAAAAEEEEAAAAPASPEQDGAAEDEDATPAILRGPGEWYVVHTYAGYENKVRANLGSRIQSMQMEEKIFDVVIPMEDVMEIKGGKKQVVQKKVFPGYLLVRMVYDNDSWYVVRNTPGVTGFVSSGTGTKPTPLSPREVEKILAVKKETAEKPQYRLEFEEGDVVRIIVGPFADFTGTISEINVEQSKLKVMVNIFDRETPVELAFDQVAKA
jgi:transcription termination/antitermination protein NusG